MSTPSRILAVAALCALVVTPGWGQAGLIRGTVIDDQQRPIADVRVTVTSGRLSSFRKTLRTDKEGQFRLRFQVNQIQYEFDFLFEKPGYESFIIQISPSATREIRERFEMKPSETRVVERHGDLASVVSGSSNLAVESFNAGLSAQRDGNQGVARAQFEEALAADPDLGPAHVALAQVLLDQEEYVSAMDSAQRALELQTSRADALRVKYQALRALGRDKEAKAMEAELQQAEGASTSARRLYNEGSQAFQDNDHETALAKFRQAAELDPSLLDAQHAVATLELAAGNHEAATRAAEKALELGSEDVRTLRVLYEAYASARRSQELAEIVPRLAAVDPDFGGAKLLELAAEMWNSGQVENAVAICRQALAIDPTLAKAYYFIGLDHIAKSENLEAKAALEKFIDLAPDDTEAATAREILTLIE